MTNDHETSASDAWMTLSPEPDITAYDLWRCLNMGQSVRPDEVAGIPEDLRRHYKRRSAPGQYE